MQEERRCEGKKESISNEVLIGLFLNYMVEDVKNSFHSPQCMHHNADA